ncbi:MAG: DUF309 domain-containing protein [Candidatus Latescibacteria bacterium]|nr:DUF309 domain-containing protein [Candidatus Latescibacterota bacterium]
MEPIRVTEEEARALGQGIQEFNEGFYFEAHDTLEEAWHGIRDVHRAFYHGLIQMATGLYHLTGENLKGAESQIEAGLRKLLPFQPAYLGVEVSEFVRRMGDVLEAIRAARSGGSGRSEIPSFPRLSFDPEGLARHVAEGAE